MGTVLITGASGFLGSKLFNRLIRKHNVSGTQFHQEDRTLDRLDITDSEAVMAYVERLRPDIIVHAASLINADLCEKEPDRATAINTEGTRHLALAAKHYGAKLIYLSSDYVFSGDEPPYHEESTANPVNHYGRTKLDGEHIVREYPNHLIIRPTILYGYNPESTRNTYVEDVLDHLRKKNKFIADNQIIKYPLLIDDLCDAIATLIEKNSTGTYNIGPEQGVTRYEWAKLIATTFNLDPDLIQPGSTPALAKKPRDARLASDKIQSEGITITRVTQGLSIYRSQQGCMFNMIYSAKPDQLVLGQNASMFRIQVGKALAQEHPVDADVVVPVPESGIFGATGYAEISGTPMYFAILRDYYTRKTLFESNQGLRSELLRQKLVFVPELIRGKKIVVIDEAILSGTTLEFVIAQLKTHGAAEIHIRIPSPPMRFNCPYKVLDSKAKLLAAHHRDEHDYHTYKSRFEEELKKQFGVDSLRFLSLEAFKTSLDNPKDSCVHCFM